MSPEEQITRAAEILIYGPRDEDDDRILDWILSQSADDVDDLEDQALRILLGPRL